MSAYIDLLQEKHDTFGRDAIDTECSTARQQWRSINNIVATVAVNADKMHKMRACVYRRCSSTVVHSCPSGLCSTCFPPLTDIVDVVAAVHTLPDKHMIRTDADQDQGKCRHASLHVVPCRSSPSYITPLLKSDCPWSNGCQVIPSNFESIGIVGADGTSHRATTSRLIDDVEAAAQATKCSTIDRFSDGV